MDAGPAALVSAMRGCGPVTLPLETERLATIVVAMENMGPMASEPDSTAEVLAETDGKEFREKTDNKGVVSSRRASARVPSSQLAVAASKAQAKNVTGREKENRKVKAKSI